MKRKRGARGFTIAEVLISIAILAISLTGVLAALAYDAFSAGQSAQYVFAVNYSRKIMDLLQSGQVDAQIVGIGQQIASPSAVPSVYSNQNNDGTNWHNLDGTPSTPDYALHSAGQVADDFWGLPGSQERLRFDAEKNKYGVNICWYRDVSSSGAVSGIAYRNLLVNVIVTTRWRVRRGFRSVQLRSCYVANATP